MQQEINIRGRKIGSRNLPFIVAEMSGNHNQSLERALAIVEASAKAQVDALKVQTAKPETMTLDIHEREFRINHSDNLWYDKSLHQLYQQACMPWEWHKPIFDKCQELGIISFSTAFDETAVDFLESLDVPCYKIASFENTDLPLIRKVARTGKPIIISTGMATVAELDEAVQTARASGCKDLILLKCTSTYPATPEDSNLMTIPHMRDLFNVHVGLSDHTMGIGTAVASIALGATFIEKHFTLCRADGGIDSAFSMEPAEMKQLVIECERSWQAIGNIHYGATESEKDSLVFRRSLYVAQDMKAGDIFTSENLKAVRPGLGLPSKYYELLIGKSIKQNAKVGTPIGWQLLI